jgi:hypothetical protein
LFQQQDSMIYHYNCLLMFFIVAENLVCVDFE